MRELLCFPIMLSLAEVRNDLTIPVLSAVHLRALHVGLGETEAGGRNIPTPIQLPWCHGQLPFAQQQDQAGRAGPGCRERTDLVLAAPAGIVQVVVAPVVMGPVLGLLIQPVELVGAALHVILQRVQVLLPLL